MIEGEWLEKVNIWWNEEKHVHMEYRHIFKWNFRYKDNKNPWSFTYFEKWEVIWYEIVDWEEKEVKAKMDGYIILPKDPNICIEWKEVFYFWKSMG